VYDATARDALAMLGDTNFGGSDNGEIPDYKPVQEALRKVPEVAAVLPMGIGNATVFGANDIDRTLEDLRSARRDGDPAREATLLERIQRIAGDLGPELDRMEAITADKDKIAEDRATLARVTAPGFSAEYSADPVATIDWMDGHLAPLATDGRLAYFRLLGTDVQAFAQAFPRYQIVKGTSVPPNERGIVLNESMVEQWLKNPIAREFDAIKKEIDTNGGAIGTSGTLYDRVQRMSRHYQRVLYQLDSAEAAALEPVLRAELGGQAGDLTELLKSFLAADDANFHERFDFFYKEIAPKIRLYDINVGDTLPLRAFTKSGYLKSLNVKVYGVYRYRGVEDGDSAAGAYCILDMLSFRDLYGKMTDAQRAELAEIKQTVGAKEVSGGNIEDELFGGGGAVESEVKEAATLDSLDTMTFGRAEDRVQQTFTQDELETGVATNVAVFLKDPTRSKEGLAAVQKAADDAGFKLKVIDWREASGLVGQAATVIQLVLYTAVGVLFLVAMIIINIALVLATLERTSEIGTMRAVGAKRGFVVLLFVLETLLVAVFSCILGSGLAFGLIQWLHSAGIPAGNDFLSILFGGRAMFPDISWKNFGIGFGLVTTVSAIATIYPSVLAAGVPPVVALQGKE
jgi:hypothetical protein